MVVHDFYFCGMNPIDMLKVIWRLFCLLFHQWQKPLMPNIGAFLRCHKKSQKKTLTCSSVRGHTMWYL